MIFSENNFLLNFTYFLPNFELIRISFFLWTRWLRQKKLNKFKNVIAIIYCQLKIYFSLHFFDIMIHLIIHLVREIRSYNIFYLWWMYKIKLYMKILKVYVKDHIDLKYLLLIKCTLFKKLMALFFYLWE